MTDPNNVTHVNMVTQRIKAIPPEKLADKVGRTVGGVVLAAAGGGLLAVVHRGWLAHNVWLERIGVGAIALGGFTASFEIVRLPLDYAIAKAKDIAGIARGLKNGGAP